MLVELPQQLAVCGGGHRSGAGDLQHHHPGDRQPFFHRRAGVRSAALVFTTPLGDAALLLVTADQVGPSNDVLSVQRSAEPLTAPHTSAQIDATTIIETGPR